MDEDGKNRLDRKSEKLDNSRVGVKVFIDYSKTETEELVKTCNAR